MVDRHWSRVGLGLGIGLLAVSPLLPPALGPAVFLLFLQLPLYMLHQFEEHGRGAFKAFVNANRPPGTAPVTDRTIFLVNILGVWLLNAVNLAMARATRPGNGLVSPYISLLNGLLHLVMALRQRRANPGVWTGALLLIPAGLTAIIGISRQSRVTRRQHALGLAGAVLLHALTFASLRRPRA